MTNSTTRDPKQKPKKPRPDFPLFCHATGRWAKKVRGKFHYFGKIADDPKGEAALQAWVDAKDDLLAGRIPAPKDGQLTVAELTNHFLSFKQQLLDSGELSQRTFDRYHGTCGFVVAAFGRTHAVDDLRPENFRQLRGLMTKRWGPIALANEIQIVRSLFRYCFEAELTAKSVRFGPGFRKPSAKTIRQTRAANGPRMFTPDEVHRLLKHATTNLRGMVLLALNGALGNTDLAALPFNAPDLETGWLDYPRAKTAIFRRIPLWTETIDAIREVQRERRDPVDPADAGLLFIGRRGQNYLGNHRGTRVAAEMKRAAIKAKIQGRTFYDLRRTFQTIAEGPGDLVAVQSIMGHAPAAGDMSAIYRQKIDDARLEAVVRRVHDWLFSSAEKGEADDQHEQQGLRVYRGETA